MTLSRESYIKKYIGAKNVTRTKLYKKSGVNKEKFALKKTGLHGVKKIVNKKYQDTTGYLVQGKIYTAKNNIDRSLKSKKQPWEL